MNKDDLRELEWLTSVADELVRLKLEREALLEEARVLLLGTDTQQHASP